MEKRQRYLVSSIHDQGFIGSELPVRVEIANVGVATDAVGEILESGEQGM